MNVFGWPFSGGINLVVARAQNARPPNIVPQGVLPDVVIDRPGLGTVVPHIPNEDDADQRFVLAQINFVVQQSGQHANSLKYGDADGLDVAGLKTTVLLGPGIQSRGR